MIRELNARAYSPRIPKLTGQPGTPTVNVESAQERIITEIMDLRARYEERVLELIAQRKRIETAIDGLDDPDQRTILRYHYIDGKSWQKTAQLVHYSRAQVDRKHGRALLVLKDETK
ncbi:MAG: sigma-70 family RNA polymerase sigma factor [Oscillospiraceae bacterium]|nr:sigma-70 family RNA polymerase sigma factor [Oscillospiraceae bacterium]